MVADLLHNHHPTGHVPRRRGGLFTTIENPNVAFSRR